MIHPELSEQAVVSMGRRLLRYKNIDELGAGEEGAKRIPKWAREEDERLMFATKELGRGEIFLTTIYRVRKNYNHSPAAVRKRWIKLNNR